MKYRVTAPLMGDYAIAYVDFLKSFGYEVVLASSGNKKSLDLGVKHAPNQACFPFKVTIGSLFERIRFRSECCCYDRRKNGYLSFSLLQ
jgi:predicted nucleotide-binding protein (sugar kinase/HSP70/actin superfamily)